MLCHELTSLAPSAIYAEFDVDEPLSSEADQMHEVLLLDQNDIKGSWLTGWEDEPSNLWCSVIEWHDLWTSQTLLIQRDICRGLMKFSPHSSLFQLYWYVQFCLSIRSAEC